MVPAASEEQLQRPTPPASGRSPFSRRAEDRWYVADPRWATDLHRLCERALPKEFDDYRGFTRKLTRFVSKSSAAASAARGETVDDETILAVDRAGSVTGSSTRTRKLLMWHDQVMVRNRASA